VAGTLGCYNWTPGFVAEFVKVTDWSFEWGVTVAPKGPDGTRGSQVSGGSFCLTPASKHPNETFKVLEFFATKEDGIQHVLGGAGSPGARNDVWTSQELNDFNSIYGEIIKAYPDGAPPWYYPANGRASEFAETRDNNLQAIWTNEVEFDAGVEQVQELCQEVMDKEPL
jgi:ABC-type glycerol-3-phosphate transport system substrate-binding protein